MDERIISAVIGAVVVALGWMVGAFRERSRAEYFRSERIRDVQRALYAEIRAYLEVLRRDQLDSYRVEMVARMQSKDSKGNDFIPLIPIESNDTVFRAIVSDIHILPRSSIDPVVLYYSQLNVITAMIEDLRSDAFRQMDTERRIRMYSDYIDLKKEALELGEEALVMIETYAKGGSQEVRALQAERRKNIIENNRQDVQSWIDAEDVSNRGADPSGRL